MLRELFEQPEQPAAIPKNKAQALSNQGALLSAAKYE